MTNARTYAWVGTSNINHIVNPDRPRNEWTYCNRAVAMLISEPLTFGILCKQCSHKAA